MKKSTKLVLALILITAMLFMAACGGDMANGTYKLTQITYGTIEFNITGDQEADFAALGTQLEALGSEGAGAAIAIAFICAMFYEMKMEISGNELTFTMDLSWMGSLVPDPIQTTTVKYSLDGDKIVVEGEAADTEKVEGWGSFTYSNGKIVLLAGDEDVSFGLVFTKQ